jgi:hypothetical protein
MMMTRRLFISGALVLAPVLALPVLCAAQNGQNQKPADAPACDPASATADKPCPPASNSNHPSAADQFPFPGEADKPAPDTPAPSAPTPAAPSATHPSAADEHPFPGEADSSSSSSSSSSSDSSSSSSSSSSADDAPPPQPDGKPFDDKGDNPKQSTQSARRKLPKVENPQSDEDRATEDLKVSRFYEQSGNLNAAYLRAKDAVKYQPNDPDTHYALAHIAQKMDKRDEAITEFNAYLKLDPDGDNIKQAKKALNQLQK